MHQWGDGWEHWDKLGQAVERAYELAKSLSFEYMDIKEKYGTLRVYCYLMDEPDRAIYRKLYETLAQEYPEIVTELFGLADYPELLVGLVDPEKCSHYWWTHSGDGDEEKEVCHVCGLERPIGTRLTTTVEW